MASLWSIGFCYRNVEVEKEKEIRRLYMDVIMKIVSGFLFGFGGTIGYWLAKAILHLCHAQM